MSLYFQVGLNAIEKITKRNDENKNEQKDRT